VQLTAGFTPDRCAARSSKHRLDRIRLLRETGYELLDTALPVAEQQIIASTLLRYKEKASCFMHCAVAGARRFVSLCLVPGEWSVRRGHDLCEEIELVISRALPSTNVITHLEPLEDPVSWEDQT